MNTINIDKHLEKYLGEISTGWSDNNSPGIQIVLFKSQPSLSTNTYSTLGLSNSVLTIKGTKKVRQELLLSVNGLLGTNVWTNLLLFISSEMVQKSRALLRGELIEFKEPIINGSDFYGIYVTIPVLFDSNFQVYSNGDSEVVLVWLIPVTRNECIFIHNYGWSKFEDLLEEKNIDLTNLERESVI